MHSPTCLRNKPDKTSTCINSGWPKEGVGRTLLWVGTSLPQVICYLSDGPCKYRPETKAWKHAENFEQGEKKYIHVLCKRIRNKKLNVTTKSHDAKS